MMILGGVRKEGKPAKTRGVINGKDKWKGDCLPFSGRGSKGAISKTRLFHNNFSKRSCSLLMFKIG